MTKNISAHVSQPPYSASRQETAAKREAVKDDTRRTPESASAERMIRKVIAEEARKSGAERLPERAPSRVEASTRAQTAGRQTCADRRPQGQGGAEGGHPGTITPKVAGPVDPAPARPMTRDVGPRKGRLRGGIRIGGGKVALGVVLILAIWKPVLVAAAVLLPGLLLLIVYLTVGHDRIAEISADRWRRFEARWPKRAERLRARVDALALAWDIVLDRLPESWAARLALPDVSGSVGVPSHNAPDPFDRLAKEARDG